MDEGIEWDYYTATLSEDTLKFTHEQGLDCDYGRIPEIELHTCTHIATRQYNVGEEMIEVLIQTRISKWLGWSYKCGEVATYGVNEPLSFAECDQNSQLQVFYAFPQNDYSGNVNLVFSFGMLHLQYHMHTMTMQTLPCAPKMQLKTS